MGTLGWCGGYATTAALIAPSRDKTESVFWWVPLPSMWSRIAASSYRCTRRLAAPLAWLAPSAYARLFPAPFARLFPAAPGFGEDNGALLGLIAEQLPADRLRDFAATSRAVASAMQGFPSETCRPPLAPYKNVLWAGNQPALRWYIAREPPTAAVANDLAHRGNLAALTWAWRRYPANCAAAYGGVCDIAAANGHLGLLQWARAQAPPCPWTAATCDEAYNRGQLDVLHWARANGCVWSTQTCKHAAYRGDLAFLQWARAQGCPWDEDTCSQAARMGDFGILRWAYEHGCPWDSLTCDYAAGNGHLEILQWARARGCPWTSDTCDQAAVFGHLHVLQWARAQDPPCPWTPRALEVGSSYLRPLGFPEVRAWVLANGCPEYD